MFGGGGMNPRKMKQMMKQMGIDVEELDAERVVIETADGDDLVFDGAQVTKMDAQGQETYQIVGSPDAVADAGGAAAVEGGADASAIEAEDAADEDDGIPEEDVRLVAEQAGVSKDDAREALEAANGEPARAISDLQ
ncbi:nascent polypeptide-associated complex protein [Halorubrum ezzemoulense]|jgi:nascent polypeptide-associated complex subunit alpha|uniref:Nascent polypeptide-associated complex protein n=2 Tax=Halorubrum ezzemoulense TaxID=337243 RepID=A0A256K5K1_HALEZ|nr:MULTISPECIES: nascent polypeptide-associated complex protein [Halorubrum]MDB2224777.1 nascent polypeptide-associated complex protein [Halorubrum ezzemoulense]MDB2237347.1 nascent polypeptide-associated complex protein [Halorubrum ezzemoulense]MDB2241825.1 nascent polypeptide-associated complex protein [Halorubrum ezzemoulense]MDB2245356.1 nascent polypeptide-associated complex protein [Halorubrum ezzemoulense]MDB2246703.1 nascent polypeptide-associated complex protein [Halorubrum ezzemoulen